MAAGILLLRLAVGLTMAGHGAQKLFGSFGGPGIAGFAGMLDKLGIRPSRMWALVAGLCEFGGGIGLAVGLLTPLACFAIIASMLVAITTVHLANGFWNQKGGIEFPFTLVAAALAVALTGPGAFSLDALLRIALPEPETFLIAGLGTIAGVAVALASRRPLVESRREVA